MSYRSPSSGASETERRDYFDVADESDNTSLSSAGTITKKTQGSSVDPDEHEAKCLAECEDSKQVYYCSVCEYNYCDLCWDTCLPHKKNLKHKDGRYHEKVNLELTATYDEVFNKVYEGEELDELHIMDRSAKWFGIKQRTNKLGEEKVFLITQQRLEQILDPIAEGSDGPIYPSIVTFLGETGAGKSTLIKALIKASHIGQRVLQAIAEVPVSGSINNSDVPSSGDVHVYGDPRSRHSEIPILFADCEGIEGGNRDPVAEIAWRGVYKKFKDGATELLSDRLTHICTPVIQQYHDNPPAERKITQRSGTVQWTRSLFVSQIYPRFLFPFSDTIVFIVKNAKTIETVVEKLITWAEFAVEHSSNQPTLPSALIVLNKVDTRTDEKDWDPDERTKKFFRRLEPELLVKNKKFQQWTDKWMKERNHKVETVEELIKLYYSDVRVIAIPDAKQTDRLHKQLLSLYGEISSLSIDAKERKTNARMALEYKELLSYLNCAFDHFTEKPDEPFNFIDCAFRKNPIPDDFSGRILSFLIEFMRHLQRTNRDTWGKEQKRLLEREVYGHTCNMIASAILLDSTRNNKIGSPDLIYRYYLTHIKKAIEAYRDLWHPCEYITPTRRKIRCVNVRTYHIKGHQSESGKLIGKGEFQSSIAVGQDEEELGRIYDLIYSSYMELSASCSSELDPTSKNEAQVAGERHRVHVLRHFFRRFSTFFSPTLCLVCIGQRSKYPLECGHAICERCLKCFGSSENGVFYSLRDCPICSTVGYKPPPNEPCVFSVSLNEVAPCVLSLDGGGVRGIIQIEALSEIQKAIGLGVPVIEFFDLVVGTSCGGVLALGLGDKRTDIEELSNNFEKFCRNAFRERIGSNIAGFNKVVRHIHHNSRFETKGLERELKSQLGERPLFGFRSHAANGGRTLATAVVAARMDTTCIVFGSYNPPLEPNPSSSKKYDFFRPERAEGEIRSWEAARATSAAPSYFKPFRHPATELQLQDGAICYNNPAAIAGIEWKKLIPGPNPDTQPDLFLSLGTGISVVKEKVSLRDKKLGWIPFKGVKQAAGIAYDIVEQKLDTARAWEDFLGYQIANPTMERYKRLTVQLDDIRPDLANCAAIPGLRSAAQKHFKREPEIKKIANQLIASLFYYKLDSTWAFDGDESKGFSCKGFVRCRLRYRPKSSAFSSTQLAHNLRSRLPMARVVYKHSTNSLKGRRKSEEVSSLALFNSPSDVDEFAHKCMTFGVWEVPLNFVVPDKESKTEIWLEIGKGERLGLISAFPRQLVMDDERLIAAGMKQQAQSPSTQTANYSWNSDNLSPQNPTRIAPEDWLPPSPEALSSDGSSLRSARTMPHLSSGSSAASISGRPLALRRNGTGSRSASSYSASSLTSTLKKNEDAVMPVFCYFSNEDTYYKYTR